MSAYTDKFTLSSGDEIIIRGLRRRDLKLLRSEGKHPSEMGGDEADKTGLKADEVMDRVLELVLDPSIYEKLDDLYQGELLLMFKKVMELTYVSEQESKNSE
jgi:hypothetical protein